MRTLIIVISVLIIYGSLYPFSFSAEASAEWTWRIFLGGWKDLGSRGDAIGNVLLFIPYGVVGHVLASRAKNPFMATLLLALIGSVIAVGVQVAQIWIPSRVPAVGDAWWNLFGIAGGFLGARYVMRFTELRWESSSAANFALILLGLFVAAELIPLVPSLDLQSFKDSVKPLINNPVFRLERFLFHASGVLVAGRLLADLVSNQRDLSYLLILVVAIWFGKVLVVSTALSIPLISGSIAGVVVWSIVRKRSETGRSNFVMLFMFLTYTVMSLAPFELRHDPTPFSWLPFAGLLQGSMLANVHGLVERIFMYTSIIWLYHGNGSPLAGIVVLLPTWVWSIEAIQTWMVGRSGSFTEPMLVLALVYFVARHAPEKNSVRIRGNEDRSRVQQPASTVAGGR